MYIYLAGYCNAKNYSGIINFEGKTSPTENFLMNSVLYVDIYFWTL